MGDRHREPHTAADHDQRTQHNHHAHPAVQQTGTIQGLMVQAMERRAVM